MLMAFLYSENQQKKCYLMLFLKAVMQSLFNLGNFSTLPLLSP